MLILYIMLKIFWKLETSLLHATLRIVRGAVGFGYGTDKTLDDIQILYDSPHFLVVNKSCDVIINHRDQERAGEHIFLFLFHFQRKHFYLLVKPDLLFVFVFSYGSEATRTFVS